MHLVVDAVGTKHSGAATVLLDFLKVATAEDRISKITVFCSPRKVRTFTLSWSKKIRIVEPRYAGRSRFARVIWHTGGLAHAAQNHGANVVFCMSGQGGTISPTPHVTFVQQSLPFSSEALNRVSYKRRFEMTLIRRLMRQSCHSAQRVIVQTPTMARWVSSAFKLEQEKIDVVIPTASLEPGVGEDTPELELFRKQIYGAKLLYVGNNSEYKMLTTLIKGMGILNSNDSLATLFLTVPPFREHQNPPGVIFLGRLRRNTLKEAYTLASAVVQPSLVETVGLPMLEAMSMGTPVIAADRPYAHDVCQDAAVYYDPLNPLDFADKAKLVLQNSQVRKQLTEKGFELTRKREETAPYQKMVNIILSTTQ